MLKKCLFLFLALSCHTVFGTVDNYWTGNGDGVSWHSAANWSEGHYPVYNTNGSEKAYIGMNATTDYTVNFSVYASYDRSPGNFYLGQDSDPTGTYTLNITSTGFFCNVYSYLGPQGILNVEGGNYTTFGTKQLDGVVNVNNALYKNRSYVWRIGGYMAVNPGSTFRIQNGSRFSESSGDITVPNSYFTGTIDIWGGEMIMDGDCTTAIAWHINNGNIIAHGDTGTLDYYYDATEDETIITSTATENFWTGDGDGISWDDSDNWSAGHLPVYNNDRSELTYIGINSTDDYSVDITTSGGTKGTCGYLYLGRDSDPIGTYTMNVESSGEFYNVFTQIGSQGVLNINGGYLNTYGMKQLDGLVTVNGGTFKNRSSIWKIGGYVTVYQDGLLTFSNGTKFSSTSSDITAANPNFTGTIDLWGGQMKFQNDCTTAIAWHVNNGNIIAYGGNGSLGYAYDANANITTVKSYGEYYLDSINGNDSNTGTSPSQAWQSLSKFNSATFQPGDHIYFKAGCTWNGCMEIGDAWGPAQGSGTAANPIVIDAYGDISNKNNKPRINGYPYGNDTLKIQSIEYWEINNLQLTNDGPTDATPRTGVSVSSVNYGQMNHIYLKDLYIHDVRGVSSLDGWGTGAISTGRWDPDGGQYESYLNDILIEDCYIEDADPYGVFIGGGSKLLSEQQATNVVVRGNYFEDLRSSAVLVTGTESALVEYNEVNTAKGVGMWPFAAHNTLFQYNEVYNTVNEEGDDGNAYDCDYECTGTTYQYNYSHDNPGGFMLICNEPQNPDNVYGNQNPTIRYNISINDGSSDESIFYCWKEVTNASIYNNFIYIPSGKDVHLVSTGHTYGDDSLYVWNNNIIYSHGTARYLVNDDSTHWWDNNCFYGTHKKVWYRIGDFIIWQDGHPSGNNNITSNPNVVSLSYGYGFDSIVGYKLWSNSPCIGAGLAKYPGGEDFWGNPLFTGNPDIGPHEQ